MRVRTVISTVIALVMISVFALPVAEAQQATSTPGTGGTSASGTPVMCDSALVLLVGLAEKDFGYMPPSGLGPFEWGQFTSMFGGSSLTMATQQPGAMATQESGASSGAMSTAEATMTVTLQVPVVLGEDPQCTQLRQDVVTFLTSQSGMMNSGTSSNSSSSSGTTSNGTSGNNGTSGGVSTELPGAPMATASAAG